jgi:uncharacterized protein (TIGR03000 family)
MYSLLLMTAMSTAPSTAEFGGLLRDWFGGCRGSCSGSCTGTSYGSCSGRSTGCYGSSCCGGGFGSRLRAFFNRGSCYGSCSGRSGGCYGSCTGSYVYHGSCCGGGGGYPPTPMYNDYPMPGGGVPYAAPAPAVSFAWPSSSPCDCCGSTLGTPMPVGNPYPVAPFPPTSGGVPQAQPMPAQPPASVPESPSYRRPIAGPTGLPTGNSANRATVVVHLPTDAKLYAEGRPLTLTSAERTFVSPPLPGGPEYSYTFRAEYTRNGETITQAKRITVKPGQMARLEFADLTLARAGSKNKEQSEVTHMPLLKPIPPTLAGGQLTSRSTSRVVRPGTERARITVKMPAGATLYVDGKRNERTEAVREFSTPPLPPGQEFAYLMKAEVIRDGRPEYQLTKVTFRAGEIVTVDFTAPAKQ